MGLFPYAKNCGMRMRRECRERVPRHRLQRKSLVSNPGMHHGTCVTHVRRCMSGSLTRVGGENVPGIPGACTIRDFTYLARGLWFILCLYSCITRSIKVHITYLEFDFMQWHTSAWHWRIKWKDHETISSGKHPSNSYIRHLFDTYCSQITNCFFSFTDDSFESTIYFQERNESSCNQPPIVFCRSILHLERT